MGVKIAKTRSAHRMSLFWQENVDIGVLTVKFGRNKEATGARCRFVLLIHFGNEVVIKNDRDSYQPLYINTLGAENVIDSGAFYIELSGKLSKRHTFCHQLLSN